MPPCSCLYPHKGWNYMHALTYLYVLFLFEIWSYYVALTDLELTM